MIHPLTPKADILSVPERGKEAERAVKHLPAAAGADSESTTATDVRSEPEAVSRAVAKIRDALRNRDQRLEIEVDPDLHRVVVKLINKDTNEVIRQIPLKEALEWEKRLSEQKGFLIEERA